MRFGRLRHAALAGGLAVVLAACSGGEGDGRDATAAGSSAPGSSAPAGPTPASGSPGSASAVPTPRASASPTARRTPGPPSQRTPGPSVAVSTLPPKPVGSAVPLKGGVTVTITGVKDVEVGATGPGEIAGPAVSVEVRVRNAAATAFNLSGLAVNASYGGGTPASPTTAGGAKPLSGSLGSGQSATGMYVFLVPKEQSGTLRVEVSSADSPSIAVFQR
jgi:hypothetical protein